ncbi:hypothetical protein V6N13_120847 [Hibiscus sabdariffa]|uniref:Uncharacterized protein n=1 Tax=Hibiscus sabdariffa TaxID=183260 RepID=A0ABR2E621_9ROSI
MQISPVTDIQTDNSNLSFNVSLFPAPQLNRHLFAEVGMGSDASTPTVRVTVLQASTVFYDTPATLDKAERLLTEAVDYGSQLVVLKSNVWWSWLESSSFTW